MNKYVGIDYGLGRSNVDSKTGIRYGVISQHSVGQAWYDSAEADYGEAHCGKCGNACVDIDHESVPEEREEWDDEGNDYACVNCKRTFWSDEAFGDEPIGWNFSDDEYTLTDCLDSDIFVLKSPYYALGQFCSPCVPGAVNLDTETEDGVKGYCLGHEWFEDNKAPYRVFRVSDDTEVFAEKEGGA